MYDDALPPNAHFYEVAFDIAQVPESAVWDKVILKESGWAYARPHSVREQMRICYNDIINKTTDTIASNSVQRAAQLAEQFSEEKMMQQFIDAVIDTAAEEQKQQEVENLLKDLL